MIVIGIVALPEGGGGRGGGSGPLELPGPRRRRRFTPTTGSGYQACATTGWERNGRSVPASPPASHLGHSGHASHGPRMPQDASTHRQAPQLTSHAFARPRASLGGGRWHHGEVDAGFHPREPLSAIYNPVSSALVGHASHATPHPHCPSLADVALVCTCLAPHRHPAPCASLSVCREASSSSYRAGQSSRVPMFPSTYAG